MPSSIKRKTHVKIVNVGNLIDPILTLSGVPDDVEVGDEITPSILVESAPSTPVEGVAIDFMVKDVLGAAALGIRQLTDVNGEAEASESYYVPEAEAGNSINFIIQVNKKKL